MRTVYFSHVFRQLRGQVHFIWANKNLKRNALKIACGYLCGKLIFYINKLAIKSGCYLVMHSLYRIMQIPPNPGCRRYSFRPLDTRPETLPSRYLRCCTKSGRLCLSYRSCPYWLTCLSPRLMVMIGTHYRNQNMVLREKYCSYIE